MRLDVTMLDVHERRRSLIFYPLGLALYALVIVAMYPTFKNDAGLETLSESNSTLMSLFGAGESLTSPTGWINGNIYGNFLPLIVLVMTIGYGSSSLAGQNESGVLGLVATNPISRAGILVQKFVVLGLLAVAASLATMICVFIGREFDVVIDIGALVGVSIAVIMLGMLFGALALGIGALSQSRGSALGITSAIAVVMYLISSLAPVIAWVDRIRWLSPFWWSVGAGQLTHGVDWEGLVALVVTTAVLVIGAIAATRRMDIR